MRCPTCGLDNLPGADECTSCLKSLMQEDVPAPATPLEASIMDDPIAALDPSEPECVPVGTPVRAAIAHMQAKNVGYLLILDGDRKLQGIFTEDDLVNRVLGQEADLEATPVDRYMTPNPTTLKAGVPISQSLHLMAIQAYHYLPVVDDQDRVTGLLSFRRIARFMEQEGTG